MSKNILAVFAHPDDCELKAFGTLRKYQDLGYNVFLLIACCGSGGISVQDQEQKNINVVQENRISETEKALENYNFNIKVLNYNDGNIFLSRDLIIDIEKVVKKIMPEIIITHFYDIMGVDHQDHASVSKATINVASRCSFVNKILLCEPLMTLRSSFTPNVFVDITTHFEEKIEALQKHNSQHGRFYLERIYQENKASFYAGSASYDDLKAAKKYEAFQLIFEKF